MNKKKIFAICLSCVMAAAMSVCCFATAETFDVAQITGALSAFSTANLLTVIVAGLGIAVPLVLMWFAFRWIYGKAKGALKKGV